MTDSDDALIALRLAPSELQWALNHPDVHGIGSALEHPVTMDANQPGDDRMDLIIRVDGEQVATAIVEIN